MLNRPRSWSLRLAQDIPSLYTGKDVKKKYKITIAENWHNTYLVHSCPAFPDSNIVLAQIRPTSGPREIHAGQMWAGSGPTLLAIWVDFCFSPAFLSTYLPVVYPLCKFSKLFASLDKFLVSDLLPGFDFAVVFGFALHQQGWRWGVLLLTVLVRGSHWTNLCGQFC